MRKLLFLLFCSSLWAGETLEMASNHLDAPLMKKMIALFHTDVLVETGTWRGGTAATASLFFREVHTIELSPKLFKKSQKLLKAYRNVHGYEGHSGDVLVKILPKIKGRVLLWLDAHWSGGDTARGVDSTAIRDELNAVKKSGIKNAIILIDDLRGFQGKPVEHLMCWDGYPTIQDLKALLPSDYIFWVLGDVGIAYPQSETISVSDLVKACTHSRFNNIEQEEIFQANAQAPEAEAIDAVYNAYAADDAFLTKYYLVWEGLLLMHRGKQNEAAVCFEKAIAAGYDKPHVRGYLAKAKANH